MANPEAQSGYEAAALEAEESVSELMNKTEWLSRLEGITINETYKTKLQTVINSTDISYKGAIRKQSADVLLKNIQTVDGMLNTSTDRAVKEFLQELKAALEQAGKKHPKWNEFKQTQESDVTKLNERFGMYVKGLIGLGLGIKSLIDFKNGNPGMAMIQLGLAAWINRVDKWVDPMTMLTNQVKFLQSKEWKGVVKKGFKGQEVAELCKKYMENKQANESELRTVIIEKLNPKSFVEVEQVLQHLRMAKTASARQTVYEYILNA